MAAVDGDAGVGVAPGVEDDAVGRETHRLQPVDEFPLHITLVVADLDVGEEVAQLFHQGLHRGGAIDRRLANTRQVQIGPIDNFNTFHFLINVHPWVLLYICSLNYHRRLTSTLTSLKPSNPPNLKL